MNTDAILTRLAAGSGLPALDVLGPTVEFLTMTDDAVNEICVMRAVIPPGVTVPLHRHDDFEDFLILSGGHQVLLEGPDGLQWRDVHAGDYIRVPGAALHAHRNVSDEPAVDLVITTARMGRFFREVARPAGAPAPTADDMVRFVETAIRYGYRLGSPEENAAVGISLPATQEVADLLGSQGISGARFRSTTPRPKTGWAALTRTEWRVAELISDGHTNRSAADELGVSTNTVNTHMRALFRKLDVTSRVQLTNAFREFSATGRRSIEAP